MNVGPRDPLAAATKWSLVSPEEAHAAPARRRRASISRGQVLRAQSPLVVDAKGIADSALISQLDRQVLGCIADWLTIATELRQVIEEGQEPQPKRSSSLAILSSMRMRVRQNVTLNFEALTV